MEPNNEIEESINNLNSTNESLVISAVKTLAQSKNQEVTPYLIEILEATNSHAVRDEVALALRDLDDKMAIQPLAKLLIDPKTDGHRGTLIYSMSGFNCIEVLPLLVDLVISGNFEVSREAFLAIESSEGEVDQETWLQCQKKIAANLANASGDKAELLRELQDLFQED